MTANIIALYIRLSLDDRDLDENKTMSVSVQNQRAHLNNFLMDHPEVKGGEIKEFIDDGYTGTNMERPAFIEMMESVRSGQVACILVKDFSRLGRNYLEAGRYLEQIFPYMGVRFISVDDSYDSGNSKGDVPGLDVVFKNIIHDYYSKELSGKVIQTRRNLAEKGLFMGGVPPFGYIRNPVERHQLLVEPESAKTVRKIFSFAMEGKSQAEIARILNCEGVENPRQRLWRLGIRRKGMEEQIQKSRWSAESVRVILHSPAVIGSITNHRVERKALGRAELKLVKKEERIVIPDMHEAIIEKEVYEKIQNGCATKQQKRRQGKVSLLSGVLKCAYCGRNLVKEGKRKKHYVCKYARVGEDESHQLLRIEEEVMRNALADIIAVAVRLQIDAPVYPSPGTQTMETAMQRSGTAAGAECRKADENGEQKKKMLSEAYEAYANGRISREIFLKQKERIQQRFEDVSIGVTPGCQPGIILAQDQVKRIIERRDDSWLTKELLQCLIKEIRVFHNTKIEITWKCEEWFQV